MDYTQMLKMIPEVRQLMSSGMSYEQIFRKLCERRGVNPDEFIRKLKETMK